MEKAINIYRFMEQAAIPPPGPLKNVEPKLVPSVTSSGVTMSSSVTASSGVGRPLGGATTVNGIQGTAPSTSFPGTLSRYNCVWVCVRLIVGSVEFQKWQRFVYHIQNNTLCAIEGRLLHFPNSASLKHRRFDPKLVLWVPETWKGWCGTIIGW